MQIAKGSFLCSLVMADFYKPIYRHLFIGLSFSFFVFFCNANIYSTRIQTHFVGFCPLLDLQNKLHDENKILASLKTLFLVVMLWCVSPIFGHNMCCLDLIINFIILKPRNVYQSWPKRSSKLKETWKTSNGRMNIKSLYSKPLWLYVLIARQLVFLSLASLKTYKH